MFKFDLENKKKEQIVCTAKQLFWKYGIKKVSIEEICKEASVSKMTYYKHFKNKNELINFILKEITAIGIREYEKIMAMDIPFIKKAELTIKMKYEYNESLSKEFMMDIYTNADDETKALLQEITARSIKMIYNDYKKAQDNNEIRKDINLQFVMYFLNHLNQLAQDPGLINMYEKPQDLMKELLNFFFYGILNKREC